MPLILAARFAFFSAAFFCASLICFFSSFESFFAGILLSCLLTFTLANEVFVDVHITPKTSAERKICLVEIFKFDIMIKKFVILILLVAVQSTKIFSQQNNIVKDYYVRLEDGFHIEQFLEEFRTYEDENVTILKHQKAFGNRRIGNFDAYYRIQFSCKNITKLESTLQACKSLKRYEAQINYSFFHIPNDPKYLYPDTMWHLYKMNAAAAWDYARGSDSIVMAVVDDNVEISHPDLLPNIYSNPLEIANDGIDNDSNGVVDDIHGADMSINSGNPYTSDSNFTHGTKVAGLADARANNSIGIAGVAYQCKLLSVKCTDNYMAVTHGVEGLFYAASMPDVKVINLSWGDPSYSQLMQEIIDSAMIYKQNKLVIIAAAGNAGDTTRNYPAACNFVISVAASDKSDNKISSSSYGNWVDAAAPGISMYTTKIQGKYGKKTEDGIYIIAGTSFSSPLVAGAAALMFSIDPNLTYSEIEHCIVTTGDTMNANFPSCNCPVGKRLNLSAAIQCICSTHTCWLDVTSKSSQKKSQLLFNNNILQIDNNIQAKQLLQVFSITGACVFEREVSAAEKINLSELPHGIYVANLNAAQEINPLKIVIVHE